MKCPVPECGEDLSVLVDESSYYECPRCKTALPVTLARLSSTIESWRPRTKDEILRAWHKQHIDLSESLQARTDDIARIVKENADQFRWEGPCNVSIVIVLDSLAKRIQELE